MQNSTVKFNKIVVAIIAFLLMLLLVYPKSIAADDETAKEVAEYDKNIYTIEAIVYNKVPLFDVNVFSDTAGGKSINENSIMGRIRKATATWYVTFMTITYVVLAVLIVYYGIKMAISTEAEKKANYKQMLYNWVKALVVAATIHYVIYIVLTLNDYLVAQIANVSYNSEEGSIYNTIKTRAMSRPFRIGITATLMYLTLLVMWFRFLWTYVKRDFTVIMYIILAPFVVGRYAYEMAGGRKSKTLANWFQRFATSVFIQSIHALFYSVFVATAMQIATQHIYSFIIALMVMNFMLDADTLYTNIFKFQFNGKDIDALDRPFKLKEDMATMYVTYSVAKGLIPKTYNAAKSAALGVEYTVKSWGDNTQLYPNENSRLNVLRNKLDEDKIRKLRDKDTERAKQKKQMAAIRIMSRKKGTQGIQAREVLRLKKEEGHRRFFSDVKFVKDVAFAGFETIFAIPIAANYGMNAGLATVAGAADNYADIINQTSKKTTESYGKYNKSLDDIVNSVETVYNETGKIEQEVANLTPDEKIEIKQMIKKYQSLHMNKFEIEKKLERETDEDINSIKNDEELKKIIDNLDKKLPSDVTDAEKDQIKEDAVQFIKEANTERTGFSENEPEFNWGNEDENENAGNSEANRAEGRRNSRARLYTREDLLKGMDRAIIRYSFGERYEEIGKSIDALSSVNSKEESKKNKKDKSFGKMIDINKFVESL